MKHIYKILIIIIIIYTGIYPVFAYVVEWTDPQEKTLRLTESFTREGMVIEASDFYENSALITVYDANKNLITRNITRINDSFDVDDILNITVIDLREATGNISASHGLNAIVDQWVKLQTRVAGKPVPMISIVPLEKQFNNRTIVSRTFTPGSEISINFSIRNEGKAVLKGLTLVINSTLPLLSGEKLNYELPELNAGNESDVITVRFKAPFAEDRKLFNISAEAKGNDVLGRDYIAVDSTYIEVRPQFDKRIDVRKYVSEKVYMGDVAVVSITIKNNLSQIIDNVSLTDSLPEGLEPVDTNLSWNFSLGAYEQKTISYQLKPQKPGTYIFQPGSSLIEYQGTLGYNAKPAKLIVSGAYVDLMKSTNNDAPVRGENISITVTAKNTGDSTAIVKLNDSVPEGYSLENKSYRTVLNTMVLHPGDSASVSYMLNTTAAGSFVLPPSKATVLDQYLYQDERYTQKASSNDLVIYVSEPLKLLSSAKITPVGKTTITPGITQTPATQIPAQAQKTSAGFEGYILIMLVIAICAIKNFKRKL